MNPSDKFYILARYFMDSYNPKPDKFPVILDCILNVPSEIIPVSRSYRHFVHSFCQAAIAAIENGEDPAAWMPGSHEGQLATKWLKEWVKEHGPPTSTRQLEIMGEPVGNRHEDIKVDYGDDD